MRFWDASGVALTPLYKLSTASVFHTDCDPSDDPQDPSDDPDMQQEEEWPPFRKVRTEEKLKDGRMRAQQCAARLLEMLFFHREATFCVEGIRLSALAGVDVGP